MAKAKRISTAVRELMSRGRQPKSTSPVRSVHTELVAALAGNLPRPMSVEVGSQDFEARADHLEKVLAALHVYFTAMQNVPAGPLDRRFLENVFQNLSADALCEIRNAAEEMRQHEIWRAS
jgi:hypothetical protein